MAASLVLFICCAITLAYALLRRGRKPIPYPPGPPRSWIIGNLLDIPQQYEYVKFAEWSNVYGPVMYLNALGKPLVVLSSIKAATELLDKRASIYSDRPRVVMLSEVIGWDWSIVLLHLGDEFRQRRKLMHQGLNPRAIQAYASVQENESRKMIERIFRDKHGFMRHIKLWACGIIMQVAYGYQLQDANDRILWAAEEAVRAIVVTGQPGAYLVDLLPILKYVPEWFPGARFKREARAWKSVVDEILEVPHAMVVKQMRDGTAAHSYTSQLMQENAENVKRGGEDVEQAIKETAAIVHTAGADSVASIVMSFVLAITLHPEVQKKLHEEMDGVTGGSRLPTFDDRAHLPYLECVISETMRWARIVPLGIAHQLRQDDEYEGMFLPAGSIVMANSWAISRDPSVYQDPDRFWPERFENPETQDPRAFVFGFGRRLCAGKALAEASVWIGVATIVASLHISPTKDEDGVEIKPTVDYTPGLICDPKPFACEISPRGISTVTVAQ